MRSATDALDTDRAIFLPIRSMDLALGAGDRGDAVQRIVARVRAGADVSRAANAISAHLTTRHPEAAGAFETIGTARNCSAPGSARSGHRS